MATPLTDSINALTSYANEVTGASDTTLSDAVYTLAQGYGQGSSSGQEVVITESVSNTLALATQIMADYSADSSKAYIITLKYAHNPTADNTVYGFVITKLSSTTFSGHTIRYRSGVFNAAAVSSNYDAAVTVGDIYEVTEIIPTTIS